MRAIRVTRTGGPDAMELVDVDEPVPGPGEVTVRVSAAGVNFIDVYYRTGAYQTPLPFTLGVEAAGVVDSVGDGVEGLSVGDRVAYAGVAGAYAEAAVAPADKVVPVPEGLPLETAAALLLQGITAHYLAVSTFALTEGDWALVHAAAGGVGLLLTQIAKSRGATVIGTASNAEKAELARAAGADEVIVYTDGGFAETVRDLTDGRGVDVVYDSVGKSTFDAGLTCLRPRGHMVLFGQSSGPVAPVDPQRLNAAGSLYLTRPTIAHYTATREELLWRAGEVFERALDGLAVRVGETHPLQDAALAHERLEGRKTTGKVLLIP